MRRYRPFICLFLAMSSATAQECNNAIPESTPGSRFSINGNEVTDIQTGLIWQRCSLGQTGSECAGGSAASYTWQGALQAAETERNATGKHWRVPNLNELVSIIEGRCDHPAINLTIFPNTPSSTYSYYWSGSTSARYSGEAWYVDFDYAESYYDSKSDNDKRVRLVRNGQ